MLCDDRFSRTLNTENLSKLKHIISPPNIPPTLNRDPPVEGKNDERGDGESRHDVSCWGIVRIAKGLLWLKVSSERGYMSSLEMEQRLFVCVCVCCVFASFCKGVVVFLLVTGLVSYEGDVSGTGSGATPTDGGCSKEPLGVMNVAGVMEAGGLVYVHSSKGYCGSTRTGPRALHQIVRSKNSNTCCLYFLLLLKLLQRGLAPISRKMWVTSYEGEAYWAVNLWPSSCHYT